MYSKSEFSCNAVTSLESLVLSGFAGFHLLRNSVTLGCNAEWGSSDDPFSGSIIKLIRS